MSGGGSGGHKGVCWPSFERIFKVFFVLNAENTFLSKFE